MKFQRGRGFRRVVVAVGVVATGVTAVVAAPNARAAESCTTAFPTAPVRSGAGQLTPDGRYLVYHGLGDSSQLYRLDRQTDTTELVSTGAAGAADRNSFNPVVSPNGRFIAFVSDATNLVPSDTNGTADVFLRDLVGGTTERVSVAVDGSQASAHNDAYMVDGSDYNRPSISDDGRYVAFLSADPALVAEGSTGPSVFVRDRQLATTTRESLPPVSGPPNSSSSQPSLSANGRYIAFATTSNAYGGEGRKIIVRDRQENTYKKITGGEGNVTGSFPRLSGDGSLVAYLRPSGSNNEVVVANVATGAVNSVSAGSELLPHWGPVISRDGSAVAFLTRGTTEDGTGIYNVVLRDLSAGKTYLAAYDVVIPDLAITASGNLVVHRAYNNDGANVALSQSRVPRLRRTTAEGLRQNQPHALIAISGFNLDGATLDFGPGVTLNSLTEDSFGNWTADVTTAPAASTAPRTLKATKQGCTVSATNTFSVAPAATITSVAPSVVKRGVSKTFQIVGTGFKAGGAAQAGPGIDVTQSAFTDATHASFTATMSDAVAEGPRDVEWHNPDGTIGICSGCLTVDAVAPNAIDYVGPSDKSLSQIAVAFGDDDIDEVATEIGVTRSGAAVTFTRSTPEPGVVLLTLTSPIDGDYAVAIKPHDDAGNVGAQVFRVAQRGEFIVDLNAYGSFQGGAYTTAGDIDGDGVDELITAAGAGGGPHVRVFGVNALNHTSSEVAGWMAYSDTFFGGVRIAAADVDGDGNDEVITGPGPGGGPHIRVWDVHADGSVKELISFMAYDPRFTGGVFVAGGQFVSKNQDAMEYVAVSPDAGGGPHVKTFRYFPGYPEMVAQRSFMAYARQFNGGVRVAAADLDGDGIDEIVTGAGAGGGPHIQAFDMFPSTPEAISSFFAYDPAFRGGVFVSKADVDGDAVDEVLVGAGGGGGPHIKALAVDGDEYDEVASFFAYDASFTGGVSAAGGDVDGDGDDDVVTTPGAGMPVTARARRVV